MSRIGRHQLLDDERQGGRAPQHADDPGDATEQPVAPGRDAGPARAAARQARHWRQPGVVQYRLTLRRLDPDVLQVLLADQSRGLRVQPEVVGVLATSLLHLVVQLLLLSRHPTRPRPLCSGASMAGFDTHDMLLPGARFMRIGGVHAWYSTSGVGLFQYAPASTS